LSHGAFCLVAIASGLLASTAPAYSLSDDILFWPSRLVYDVAASDVALGDLNGDQVLDAITVGSVLLGVGDGTFTSPHDYGPVRGHSLELGDLNGDHVLDVVLAGDDSLTALLGLGDGGFQLRASYEFIRGDYYPASLALGDFNSDGILDVVCGNACLLIGFGDGTFGPVVRPLPDYEIEAVAPGDMNGDQALDLVLSYSVGGGGEVGVLLGRGDGTFHQQPIVAELTGGLHKIAVADVNRDDALDVAGLSSLSSYPDVFVALVMVMEL